MSGLTEQRAMAAIEIISRETGYPPDAQELAEVLGCTTKQVLSSLMGAKRRGRVRYDDEGRFVLRARDPQEGA